MSYMNPDEEFYADLTLIANALALKCPDGTTALKTGTWLQARDYLDQVVSDITRARVQAIKENQ